MSQFKPSFVKEIYDSLRNSCFSIHDFEVELPSKGKVLLNIRFKHKSNYCLTVSEETETSVSEYTDSFATLISPTRKEKNTYTVHYVSMCPGEYKLNERVPLSGIREVTSLIPKWCNYINDDISARLDIGDGFESLREQLEELISTSVTDESEMFTGDELDKVKEKLDHLYSKFEELKEKNLLNEAELKKIKSQLAEAKDKAHSYPKALWARVTNNKILQTLGDFAKSKEGRELVLEGIKKLFLS